MEIPDLSKTTPQTAALMPNVFTPWDCVVGHMKTGRGPVATMVIATLYGQLVLGLQPKDAIEVGKMLMQMGRELASGLVVADARGMTPPKHYQVNRMDPSTNGVAPIVGRSKEAPGAVPDESSDDEHGEGLDLTEPPGFPESPVTDLTDDQGQRESDQPDSPPLATEK